MKRILFDTDIGGDCDDVMALDLLIASHRAGDCELVGVTYSADVQTAPQCVYAILKKYGLEKIPIGRRPDAPGQKKTSDIYASKVAEAFYDPEAPKWETCPDAAKLMRRLLVEKGPVTLVVTGFLSNVAALMRTQPDEISPLSGMELMRERVEEIAVMGCCFTHQSGDNPFPPHLTDSGDLRACPEYNIVNDIPAAQEVFSRCPSPITVCPFEVGYRMVTGRPMAEAGGGKTPDSLAYIAFGAENGRDSWDPATALYGIYGAKPWFCRSVPGRIAITDEGISHFDTLNGGNCRILACALPRENIGRVIDGKTMELFS